MSTVDKLDTDGKIRRLLEACASVFDEDMAELARTAPAELDKLVVVLYRRDKAAAD